VVSSNGLMTLDYTTRAPDEMTAQDRMERTA
jgi:hypothetical protein